MFLMYILSLVFVINKTRQVMCIYYLCIDSPTAQFNSDGAALWNKMMRTCALHYYWLWNYHNIPICFISVGGVMLTDIKVDFRRCAVLSLNNIVPSSNTLVLVFLSARLNNTNIVGRELYGITVKRKFTFSIAVK